jgi:hypothetical protein
MVLFRAAVCLRSSEAVLPPEIPKSLEIFLKKCAKLNSFSPVFGSIVWQNPAVGVRPVGALRMLDGFSASGRTGHGALDGIHFIAETQPLTSWQCPRAATSDRPCRDPHWEGDRFDG